MRQKCRNSGCIKTSHFTAGHPTCTTPGHPIQSAPHPQTGFGHTNRAGFSMWLHNSAAQFLLMSLSQSLMAYTRFSCAALSETQLCPRTGQPAKSIILSTASKVLCSQEGAAWSLPLWVTWALAAGLVLMGQTHCMATPGPSCHTIPPSGQAASQHERKAHPESDRPLINIHEKP